jgi:hypothetical protein
LQLQQEREVEAFNQEEDLQQQQQQQQLSIIAADTSS